MWEDEIVREVRKVRDEYAAKFNYDPDAIFRDIKEQEKRSGRKYVSFADDSVSPNQARQQTETATPVTRDDQSLPAAQAAEH